MLALIFRSHREKTLGTSHGRRRYDLPLREDAGSRYLMLLIGLMTFLTALALSSSFALQSLSHKWTTGLENRMTIEVPARANDEQIMDREAIHDTMKKIADTLMSHPAVIEISILTDKEITALVEPWLGEDALARDIPLPGLASLTLSGSEPQTLDVIRGKLKDIAPQARLDTHQDWMDDLLRFTGTLNYLAVLVIIVIGMTMLAAVAGGIRSRMAVHEEEVQLLHLMGAPDSYISRQFQKHAIILSFKGAFAGLLAAGTALLIFGWLTQRMNMGLLPEFEMQTIQTAAFIALPVVIALLSGFTARRTVENVLNDFA